VMNMRHAGRASRAFKWLCGAWLSWTAPGCLAQHEGPQSSDTATSWLSTCGNQRDCTGSARCIDARCTLPCSGAAHDMCLAIDPGATCEAATGKAASCDLGCSADTVCAAFSPGYVCRDGHCRPGQPAATTPALTRLSLEMAGEPLLLSEVGAHSWQPVVARGDQSWSVTWLRPGTNLAGTVPREMLLYTVDVESESSWSRRSLSLEVPPSPGRLYPAAGGRIAHNNQLGKFGESWPCELHIYDLAQPAHVAAHRYECGITATAAAVPDSDDWLVAWLTDTEAQGVPPELMLARYRPDAASFVGGPWKVAQEELTFPSLAVVDGDAWLLWAGTAGTRIVRVAEVASAAPPAPGPIVAALSLTAVLPLSPLASLDSPLGFYDVAKTQRGVVVLAQPLLLSSPGLVLVHIVDGAVAETTVIDGTGLHAGLAVRPDGALVSVCYPASPLEGKTELRVGLWDARGRPVAEPLTVATAEARPEPACQLAWSQQELLVTWVAAADATNASNHQVRGRILRVRTGE
jgi:hypothetical protein